VGDEREPTLVGRCQPQHPRHSTHTGSRTLAVGEAMLLGDRYLRCAEREHASAGRVSTQAQAAHDCVGAAMGISAGLFRGLSSKWTV